MPCLKPPKREGECAPSVRKGRCWVALHWAGTARATSPLDGDARICTTEPEETKHPVLQRRYLFSERSVVRGWQDSRAVHDSRGLCSESGPFMARSSRGVFPNSCLQGFLDTRRVNLAKTSSFWMHIGDMLPQGGVFFRPRPLLAYIKRKSCHGRVPGNALGEYFATAATRRTHHGEILSPPKRGERITVKFCPRRTLRSMPW